MPPLLASRRAEKILHKGESNIATVHKPLWAEPETRGLRTIRRTERDSMWPITEFQVRRVSNRKSLTRNPRTRPGAVMQFRWDNNRAGRERQTGRRLESFRSAGNAAANGSRQSAGLIWKSRSLERLCPRCAAANGVLKSGHATLTRRVGQAGRNPPSRHQSVRQVRRVRGT